MPLTLDRAKPAVPFGGSYRLIDFVLSNLVNAGYTQHRGAHAVQVALARPAHLADAGGCRRCSGSYVAPVPAQQRRGPRWYQGSADAIYQSMNLINDERPDYIVVFGADHVYRMDASQMVRGAHRVRRRRHRRRHPGAAQGGLAVRRDQDRRRTASRSTSSSRSRPTRRGSSTPPTSRSPRWATTSSPPTSLVDALERDAADESSRHDMGGDIIPMLVDEGRAAVYDFKRNDVAGLAPTRDRDYWRDVGTLDSYHEAHLDLVSALPIFNLYNDRLADLHLPPPAARREVRRRRAACATRSSAPGSIVSGAIGRQHRDRHARATSPSSATVQRSVLLDNVTHRPGRGRPQRDHRQERRRPRRLPHRGRPRRGPAPRLHRQRGRRRRDRQGPPHRLTRPTGARSGRGHGPTHPPTSGSATRPATPSAAPPSSPPTSAGCVDVGLHASPSRTRRSASFPIEEYDAAGADDRRARAAGSTPPTTPYVVGIKELPDEPRDAAAHAHLLRPRVQGTERRRARRSSGSGAAAAGCSTSSTSPTSTASGSSPSATGPGTSAPPSACCTSPARLDGAADADGARPTSTRGCAAAGERRRRPLLALVTGARGRSGRGAQRALAIAGLPITRWDRQETRDLHKQALLGHDLLVNCVRHARADDAVRRRTTTSTTSGGCG